MVEKDRMRVEGIETDLLNGDVVHGVPTGPVDVHLKVPVGGGAEGDAAGDDLGIIEVGAGMCRGGEKIGLGLEPSSAIVVHGGGSEVFGAEGPLGMGMPGEARVEPVGTIVTFDAELEARGWYALNEFSFGVVEGGPGRN